MAAEPLGQLLVVQRLPVDPGAEPLQRLRSVVSWHHLFLPDVLTIVNKNRATVWPMADGEPRPVRRYLLLINELLEERHGKHGAQSEVGSLVGLDRTYISRLARGQRVSVGIEKIDQAIQSMRIDPMYFFGAKEPRSYRDYLNHEPPFPAWADFLKTQAGQNMTPAQRSALSSLDLSSWEPTVAFYSHVLLALQSLPPDDAALSAELNKAVANARRKAGSDKS